MKISIIGAGEVGTEIAKQLSLIVRPIDITITRRNEAKLKKTARQLKVNYTTSNVEAVKESEIIILSVRPQKMGEVLRELSFSVSQNQLLVSVSVGLELGFYEKFFPNNQIIRVMPNPFMSSKLGVMAYSKNNKTKKDSVKKIKFLFENLCESFVEVEDSKMHILTTLTSSSSGIFYYLLNSIIENAVENGLDEKTAKNIIFESAIASLIHSKNSEHDLIKLMNKACTPNGMTINGIVHLNETKVNQNLKKALEKITQRSIEINSLAKRGLE